MPTVTLRPNAVAAEGQSAGAGPVGAATVWQALSDNTDTTYVGIGPAGEYAYADVATTTLPAGAATKTVKVRVRQTGTNYESGLVNVRDSTVAGHPVLAAWTFRAATAASGVTTSANARTIDLGNYPLPFLTQAQVDGLTLGLQNNASGGADGTIKVYEAYVDLTYAGAPTTTVTGPAEAAVLATSQAPVTWSHTPGADGGAQTHYQLTIASAAEYGASGFDPGVASYTATYRSGTVASTATSTTPSVTLANSTTYRAYVRTAQTINGAPHWAAWDYNTFSTSYTVATITSVTATANNAGGYNTVVVARSGGTAWDAVTVERSRDAGVTWQILRGGNTAAAVTKQVTAWSTSSVTIRDDEAGNGETVVYRAKAHRIAGTADVWSPYVSSSSVAWTSSDFWFKNPHDPAYNTILVGIRSWTGMQRPRAKAVHHVENREDPIVVSGKLHTMNGTALFVTDTLAGATAFETLLEATDVVLIQAPAGGRIGSVYIAGLEPTEVRVAEEVFAEAHRFWEVSFVEVAAPADQT